MWLIGPILLLGLVASLSPSTIVVFILLLGTVRARVNAAAFLAGWGLSLTVVFVISYAVGAPAPTRSGGGRTVVEVLELLLGLVLVGVGVRAWRSKDVPPGQSSKAWANERFTGRLRSLHPTGAAVVGVLKQPWGLTAAAAVLVARHHPVPLATALAFVCFTVASTASVGYIFLYYSRRPEEAQERLTVWRERLVAAGPAIFAAAMLLGGGVLVLDGVSGLMDS